MTCMWLLTCFLNHGVGLVKWFIVRDLLSNALVLLTAREF
jgi:hypothetical protein